MGQSTSWTILGGENTSKLTDALFLMHYLHNLQRVWDKVPHGLSLEVKKCAPGKFIQILAGASSVIGQVANLTWTAGVF